MTPQQIKAEDLLNGQYSYIYASDGYQFDIQSVSETAKFVTVEIIDKMGFGWKTGAVKKRIKKTALIFAS